MKLSLFSSAPPHPRRLSLYDCDSSPRPRDSDETVSSVIYGAAQLQTRVTPSQGYSTPGIGWTRRRRPQLPAQLRDHLEIIPSKPCTNTHNAHSPSVISHASTPGASHACLGQREFQYVDLIPAGCRPPLASLVFCLSAFAGVHTAGVVL